PLRTRRAFPRRRRRRRGAQPGPSSRSPLPSRLTLTPGAFGGFGTVAVRPDGRVGRPAHFFEPLVPAFVRAAANLEASRPSSVVAPSATVRRNSASAASPCPIQASKRPRLKRTLWLLGNR